MNKNNVTNRADIYKLASIEWDCCPGHIEPDWDEFDGLELGTCVNLLEGTEETQYERISESDYTIEQLLELRKQNRVIHTLFGHMKHHGCVEPIKDFNTAKECRAMAKYLNDLDMWEPDDYFIDHLVQDYKDMPEGRYDDVIDHWSDFRYVQIHGVRDDTPLESEYDCQVDDENPEWYSVYVIHKDGTSQCIGDHPTYIKACLHMKDIVIGWDMEQLPTPNINVTVKE